MKEKEAAREVDASAATWAIRLDEARETPAVAAAAATWLAGDPRRAGALLRAQAALSLVDRARALPSVELPAPLPQQPAGLFSRRRLMLGGAAIGLASAAGVAALLLPGGQSYGTILGEVRRVPLEDGSLATINTESLVSVSLDLDLRQIDLRQGEAWFRVSKDPKRPFVVAAGPIRVRAVGTAFSVRRHDAGADVLVTEGVVEAWSVGNESGKLRIAADQKAYVPDSGALHVVALEPREVDRKLAWQRGHISLYGETLAEAAGEFNRYNTKKLVIADAGLAAEKLVGEFRTDEPEAFAQAVTRILGAKAEIDSRFIRLSSTATR